MSLLSLLATTDYSYAYATTDTDPAAAAAFMSALIIASLIVGIIAYVIVAIFLSRIFKKAGVEGWKAWVPVYNTWVTLELGGQAGWIALLSFIPFASIVSAIFLYIAMYHIGLKLGKSGVFVLWAIFVPLVWYIWLAFDQSRWNPAVGAPSRMITTPVATPPQPPVPPTAAA